MIEINYKNSVISQFQRLNHLSQNLFLISILSIALKFRKRANVKGALSDTLMELMTALPLDKWTPADYNSMIVALENNFPSEDGPLEWLHDDSLCLSCITILKYMNSDAGRPTDTMQNLLGRYMEIFLNNAFNVLGLDGVCSDQKDLIAVTYIGYYSVIIIMLDILDYLVCNPVVYAGESRCFLGWLEPRSSELPIFLSTEEGKTGQS